MNQHVGWCAGAGRGANWDGRCTFCGFKGRLSKYGIVHNHKKRVKCDWCGGADKPGEHENGCRLGLGPDETAGVVGAPEPVGGGVLGGGPLLPFPHTAVATGTKCCGEGEACSSPTCTGTPRRPAERDRMIAGVPAWLRVRCPDCGEHPGWGCSTRDGRFRATPHRSRRKEADRVFPCMYCNWHQPGEPCSQHAGGDA